MYLSFYENIKCVHDYIKLCVKKFYKQFSVLSFNLFHVVEQNYVNKNKNV